MSDLVTIDRAELEALRALARAHLRDEVTVPSPWPDPDGEPFDPETLPACIDIDGADCGPPSGTIPEHPDWYALTLNERMTMCALRDAHPAPIPTDRLLNRWMRTKSNPDVGEPIMSAGTVVCQIRTKLGADAIETVWQYRTNAKGHVVRTARSDGYRLGQKYVGGVR